MAELDVNALLDIAAVRRHVLRDGSDGSQDELLTDLVNDATAAIHAYCRRQFLPKDTSDVALKFFYDGNGFVDFGERRTELAAVTSVVLHSDRPASSQRTLVAGDANTESEYRLEPRGKSPEGTWFYLALPVLEIPAVRRHFGFEVTVTGKWGAGVVPGDVRRACRLTVAEWFRNPEGMQSRQLGDFGFSLPAEIEQEQSLPRAARWLLRDTRRTMVLAV